LRLVVSPSSPDKILIFAGGRKAVCKVEKDFFIYQSNPKKQSGIDLKIHFGNDFLTSINLICEIIVIVKKFGYRFKTFNFVTC